MAISEALSTTQTTLSATSFTNINSMTLTPGAGNYLVIFNASVEFANPSASSRYDFRLANAGTGIAHTTRDFFGETSLDGGLFMVTCQAEVNLGASDAVTAQYARTAGSNNWFLNNRRLIAFPKDSADITEASATANDTLNSTTFTQMDSMTLTPGAGTYLLNFSTTVLAGSGTIVNVKVYVGGSEVAHTLRTYELESSIPNTEQVVGIFCEVNPTAGQAVEIRWAHTGSATTMTAHERTLTLMKVDSADIFEASSATDSTESGTTDEVMNSMALTPGADDYLAMWSGSSFLPSISPNHVQTYSFYTNGTQNSGTELRSMHEGSVDNADVFNHIAAAITVGASQTTDVRWRSDQTTTRTIRERTMVMVRESAAGPSPISATEAGLTFTQSAAATGQSSLTTTETLTFGQSAAIVGRSALTATIAGLTKTLQAAILGLSALTATEAFAFSESAAITAPPSQATATTTFTFAESASAIARNFIDATNGITFGESAAIFGRNPVDGTTTLTFAESAAILGNTSIAATGTLTFGESAAALARNFIDATNGITFAESVAITGNGPITATAGLTFGHSAAVVGQGLIGSTSFPAFTTQAAILGNGPVTATTTLAFDQSSAILGNTSISSTTTLTFGESANLQDALGGGLSATEPGLTFTHSALLGAHIFMDATNGITFGEIAGIQDTFESSKNGRAYLTFGSSRAQISVGGVVQISYSSTNVNKPRDHDITIFDLQNRFTSEPHDFATISNYFDPENPSWSRESMLYVTAVDSWGSTNCDLAIFKAPLEPPPIYTDTWFLVNYTGALDTNSDPFPEETVFRICEHLTGTTNYSQVSTTYFKDGYDIYTCNTKSGTGEARNIFRWSMVRPYDVTSMYRNENYDCTGDWTDFPGANVADAGLDFKPDGTRMYILNGGGELNEYSLSPAWSITSPTLLRTINLNPVPFPIAQSGFFQGGFLALSFGPRGERMHFMQTEELTSVLTDSYVYEMKMDTPWDLTTLHYVPNNEYLAATVGRIQGDGIYQSINAPNYWLRTSDLNGGGWHIDEQADLSFFTENTAALTLPITLQTSATTSLVFSALEQRDTTESATAGVQFTVATAPIIGKSRLQYTQYPSLTVQPTELDDFDFTNRINSRDLQDEVVAGTIPAVYDDPTETETYRNSFDRARCWSFSETGEQGLIFSLHPSTLAGGALLNGWHSFRCKIPWDISTATFYPNFYHIDQDNPAEEVPGDDMVASSDGLHVYSLGAFSYLQEYSLSSPWQASGSSYVQRRHMDDIIANANSQFSGIAIHPSGTKAWVIELVPSTSATLHELNFGTAYDISTLTTSSTLAITEPASFPSSVNDQPMTTHFDLTGKRLFVSVLQGGELFQYNLSTAYDITTASYSGKSYSNPGTILWNFTASREYPVQHAYVIPITLPSVNSGFVQFDIDPAKLPEVPGVLAFDHSANLTRVTQSGTTTLTFGESAFLQTKVFITATSTLTFAESAAALARNFIDATEAGLTVTTSGDVVPSKGAITATSTLTFGESALLKTINSINATTVLTFGHSALGISKYIIGATTTLDFIIPANHLDGRGVINATEAGLTFTTSASVGGLGLVGATSFPTFALTGSIIGLGDMTLLNPARLEFKLSSPGVDGQPDTGPPPINWLISPIF